MKSSINYKAVQQQVAKYEKGKIGLLISLYNVWRKESDRLASLAENPYGATGFTIGKFIAEWKSTLEYESDQTMAVSYKKKLEQLHRVALRNIDINKIVSTTHLAELDVPKAKAPVKKAPAKDALLNTKEFKALPKAKQAQIRAILG